LIEICEKHSIAPDEQLTFTHASHKEWSSQLLDCYMQILKTELERDTPAFFSRAFQYLPLKLQVGQK
jgi:hypothetical protein